jgi:sporulation protein YlmC with PRC-barrel domain
MANEYNSNNRLQRLKGSDYEVKDGYTDIHGWDVKDSSGRTIGEVDDLLFDPTSRKVRYMVVDLDDNDFDLEERDVLIPIGAAQLHEKDDDVIIPNITAEQLRSLPEYDEDNFSQEHEHSIRGVFAGLGLAGATSAAASGTDFYEHDHFNEDNLYRNRKGLAQDSDTIPVIQENLEVGKREVETGGVRLRSRIVEEEVSENVSLR